MKTKINIKEKLIKARNAVVEHLDLVVYGVIAAGLIVYTVHSVVESTKAPDKLLLTWTENGHRCSQWAIIGEDGLITMIPE